MPPLDSYLKSLYLTLVESLRKASVPILPYVYVEDIDAHYENLG